MPVAWTLPLLLSFTLLLTLRAFTPTTGGATEPPPPDTGEDTPTQTSHSPVWPTWAAILDPVGSKMATSPSLLLDWFPPVTADDEFRGVIGEYVDVLPDSSESSSPDPGETRAEARLSSTETGVTSQEIGVTSQTAARPPPGTAFRDGPPPRVTPRRALEYGTTQSNGGGALGSSPPPLSQDALQERLSGSPLSPLPLSTFQTERAQRGWTSSPSSPPGTATDPSHPFFNTPALTTKGASSPTGRPGQPQREPEEEAASTPEESGEGLQNFTSDDLSDAGAVVTMTVKDDAWRDSTGANGTSPVSDCETDPPTGAPCNASDQSRSPAPPDDSAIDQSPPPSSVLTPPLFVPLYSDWNSALATWGLAWEAHVYGLGSVFSAIGAISALSLLALPLRCPPGGPYFTLLHLFLLATGGSRAFSLLYDAYSHLDLLPPLASLLLSELPLPCLTSAFSLCFHLLSQRSRVTYLSLRLTSLSLAPLSPSPRPCLLLWLALLHFAASLGCTGLLHLLPGLRSLLLLLPQGVFACLSLLLSCAYLVFYCHVRAETGNVYRLSDGGGDDGGGGAGESPETNRPHTRCPFAEAGEWGRAAGAGVGGALCLLGCGGLQLYGLLHALGVGGVGGGAGFRPWPWWGYQLGCRLCEVGACLALSLVGTQPIVCHAGRRASRTKPDARPGCWSRLPCVSPCRGSALPSSEGGGGEKSPVLPQHFPWSLAGQEKLAVCEVIIKSRSEDLPLYALAESPQNGLEPAPPRSIRITRSSAPHPLPNPPSPPGRPRGGGFDSRSSQDSLDLYSDSTVDLRPPSPIDLSRSIDQALFGETLFPHGLFHPPRLFHAASSLSLTSPGRQPPHGSAADSPLYRTSSCGDVDQDDPLSQQRPPQPGRTVAGHGEAAPSPPDRWGWRGSSSSYGSSQGLCSSPGEKGKGRPRPATRGQGLSQSSLPHPRTLPHLPHHRRYRTLSSASQDSSRGGGGLAGTEDLSESRQLERDLAVQAEFINVCRQIDSLSVCSDTIDL